LCTVQKRQLQSKNLTQSQTKNLAKSSSYSPAERQSRIENCLKQVNYNLDAVLKHFSIKVKENLTSVPARVLDQPHLEYAQKKVNFEVFEYKFSINNYYNFVLFRNIILRTNLNVTNVK